MRTSYLLIALNVCLYLTSCTKPAVEEAEADLTETEQTQAAAFLKDVDAATAGELIAAQGPPIVLDVRTPGEFADGHIEDAINIDFNGSGFKDELGKLDPEKTYLLHCRSGGRSGEAKLTVTELGFKAVYHLDGGILAWESAGLPTVK